MENYKYPGNNSLTEVIYEIFSNNIKEILQFL